MEIKDIKAVYFVGAGGIGMSAIARYFLNKKLVVAGYDKTPSNLTHELEKEGMLIHYEENVDLIPEACKDAKTTLVVYTPAIPAEHKELVFFHENNFTIEKRAQVLGTLTRTHKGLCVAGTHGKTSTSTMCAHIMHQSHVDCNAFLGGISKNYGTNYILSDKSDYVVIEADEFDRSFHWLRPWMSVITSTDPDHLDIYGTKEDVDLDKDAQVAHANIAIASSNIAGNGPGNSVERDFLSQAYSDFIYAIIIEEMGIEGAIFVALLYIFLLFRAGRIANRCENNFPAFLCMGLAILLVIQALFNMLVAVGLAPVTGQPLPLISRGGTSTVINCLYLGIILSISRTAKKKEGAQNMPNSDKIAVA
jgi:hypothetical protein